MQGSNKLTSAPAEVVVSGYFCSWSKSFLERRQLLPGETPMQQLPASALALNLNTWNIVERTINGKTERNKVGPGGICLYPAGTELKVRWERKHTIVLIGIEDSLLANAAADINENVKELMLVPDMRDFDVTQMCLLLLKESSLEAPAKNLFGDSISAALAVHLCRNYSHGGFADVAAEGFSIREKRRLLNFLNIISAKESLYRIYQVDSSSVHITFYENSRQASGLLHINGLTLEKWKKQRNCSRKIS